MISRTIRSSRVCFFFSSSFEVCRRDETIGKNEKFVFFVAVLSKRGGGDAEGSKQNTLLSYDTTSEERNVNRPLASWSHKI